MLTVQSFINNPVTSNCYVLFDRELGNDCIIVDPGSKSEKELFDYLDGENLFPKYIILTHEHFDHCWGVNEIIERYSIPIICSELCAEAIKNEKRNCSVFYDNKNAFAICNEAIHVESIGYELLFEGKKFRFILTPGHTDASICITVENYLFTGDTLLKGIPTVTKLPTGSVPKLKKTVMLLSNLKGHGYTVCPGHEDAFYLDDYELIKAL